MNISFEISKIGTHRKALMGLAAISIFVMHFMTIGVLQFSGPFTFIGKIMPIWTAVGVDIFCLLSGYGIYFSLSKHHNLSLYMYKRVARVLVPFLIITVPCYLFVLRLPIKLCFFKWTTMYYWFVENDGTWFVSFIMLMYIIAPVFFKIYSNSSEYRILLTHLVFMTLLWSAFFFCYQYYPTVGARLELSFGRIPMFFTGMLFGALDQQKKGRLHWSIVGALCIAVIVKAATNYYLGIFEMLLIQCRSILVIVLECIVLDIGKRYFPKVLTILNFNGKCSLEIYLLHVMIMRWMMNKEGRIDLFENNFIVTVICFMMTLLLSGMVNRLSEMIIKSFYAKTIR